MPKKVSEQVREKVVQLRKGGATYTQIEAQVKNPETGEALARPTTIKILREAGLTRAGVGRITPPPTSAPTPSVVRSSSAPASSQVPESPSNGVDEFMPKTDPKKAKPTPVEIQCEHCGEEFTADSEDEIPEECPECGN